MFADAKSETNEDDSLEGSVASIELLMNEKATLFWCTYNVMKDCHGGLDAKAPLRECCSQHCTNMYHLGCIKMHLEGTEGIDENNYEKLHANFDGSCQTQESNVGTQKSDKDLQNVEYRDEYLWEQFQYIVPPKTQNNNENRPVGPFPLKDKHGKVPSILCSAESSFLYPRRIYTSDTPDNENEEEDTNASHL
eukprot:9491313-Ditylum_brightwellii.AAC.1